MYTIRIATVCDLTLGDLTLGDLTNPKAFYNRVRVVRKMLEQSQSGFHVNVDASEKAISIVVLFIFKVGVQVQRFHVTFNDI